MRKSNAWWFEIFLRILVSFTVSSYPFNTTIQGSYAFYFWDNIFSSPNVTEAWDPVINEECTNDTQASTIPSESFDYDLHQTEEIMNEYIIFENSTESSQNLDFSTDLITNDNDNDTEFMIFEDFINSTSLDDSFNITEFNDETTTEFQIQNSTESLLNLISYSEPQLFDSNENEPQPVKFQNITDPMVDIEKYNEPSEPSEIERAFFQYAIDYTKVLARQPCHNNVATSPMARLILLVVLAYRGSNAEKLLFSEKLHLNVNDFNLTVGANGGVAHAIKRFLFDETKLLPFTSLMWIASKRKNFVQKCKLAQWENVVKELGITTFPNIFIGSSDFYGTYMYEFVQNWSSFYNRCVYVHKRKFHTKSRMEISSKFITMIGIYVFGNIKSVNAKFIQIPFKIFKGHQMVLIIVQPRDKTTKIRKLVMSEAFSKITYKDFTRKQERYMKVSLPSITIKKCENWWSPRVLQTRRPDITGVKIISDILVQIIAKKATAKLCNKADINRCAGKGFIVNRPSLIFIMWQKMILASAILDTSENAEDLLAQKSLSF